MCSDFEGIPFILIFCMYSPLLSQFGDFYKRREIFMNPVFPFIFAFLEVTHFHYFSANRENYGSQK